MSFISTGCAQIFNVFLFTEMSFNNAVTFSLRVLRLTIPKRFGVSCITYDNIFILKTLFYFNFGSVSWTTGYKTIL